MAAVVKVGLDLVTGKFMKGTKKADKGLKKLKKSASAFGMALGAAVAGFAVGKMISFGKELVALAKVQEQAESGLAAALKQKNAYTQEAFDNMTTYASALQSTTTFGDEQIIGVQRQLVQFGLLGTALTRATKLTLDMAASGRNMAGSAIVLGRAFAGETSMLTRYGLKLEDVAAAGGDFNAVMTVANRVYGNMAESMAAIPTGKLDQMANAWGDIKESAGSGIAAGLAAAVKEMNLGADGLSKFNDATKELVKSGLKEFILDVAAGFTALNYAYQNIAGIATLVGFGTGFGLSPNPALAIVASKQRFALADRAGGQTARLAEKSASTGDEGIAAQGLASNRASWWAQYRLEAEKLKQEGYREAQQDFLREVKSRTNASVYGR